MGNQGKFTKKQSKCLSLYFRSDFTFGDETYTVDGETSFLRLPAFLSRIVVGVGIFLRLNQVLAAQATKITSPLH